MPQRDAEGPRGAGRACRTRGPRGRGGPAALAASAGSTCPSGGRDGSCCGCVPGVDAPTAVGSRRTALV